MRPSFPLGADDGPTGAQRSLGDLREAYVCSSGQSCGPGPPWRPVTRCLRL